MEVRAGQIWLDAWGDEVVVESVDDEFVVYSFRHKNGELDKAFYTTTNFAKHHEFLEHIEPVASSSNRALSVKTDDKGVITGISHHKEGVPRSDAINHPEHYISHPSGIECIEVTRHMSFAAGNVIKYLWRNGLKDGEPSLKDLKKAAWYLNDMIDQLETNGE